MVIRSDFGRWFAGAAIWVLGMTPVCVLIAYLTADTAFASVPKNILLFGAFGGPLSTASCRAQSKWHFLSRQTLQFWVTSIAWSSALLFLSLGSGSHYPKSLGSRIGFSFALAAAMSVICFVPDCAPRKQDAP